MQNSNAVPSKNNNRHFLLLFFICCALPFVAAKLALTHSWFPSGVTNKGQWLDHEIQLLPIIEDQKQHWHLVYVKSKTCDADCELALYTLQQIYSGLGRQQEQVSAAIVAEKTPEQLTKFPSVKWFLPSADVTNLQDQIVIVDHQGIAILRYPVASDQQHMLSIGKDIRTDLRHLMAYDRGGV